MKGVWVDGQNRSGHERGGEGLGNQIVVGKIGKRGLDRTRSTGSGS